MKVQWKKAKSSRHTEWKAFGYGKDISHEKWSGNNGEDDFCPWIS